METVLKYAPPIVLQSLWQQWMFLLLPALGALLGAFLGQGSFLRIVGAAIGAGARDFTIFLLVANGWLAPSNPHWHASISLILTYFCASGAAIMSTLAPYRGKILLTNAALGGFAGQFFLGYVLAALKSRELRKPVRERSPE